MKNKIIIPALIALFTLGACTKDKTKVSEEAIPQQTQAPKADSLSQQKNELSIVGDEVLVPEFKVKINLDKKIFEALKNNKESIIASYYFYGDITDENQLPEDIKTHMDLYGLTLQEGQLEIADIQQPEVTFDFKNIKIPKKLYDAITDKKVYLNINFYSGRKAFENNILDIDAFDSAFKDILNNNNLLTLSCKLLDANGNALTKTK